MKKKKIIILSLIVITILIVIFSSYSIFKDKEKTEAILAYFYDGENHNTLPKKDDGYVIDEMKCSKAVGTWDNNKWEAKINDIEGKFECNLSFKILNPYHKLTINPNGGTYNDSPGKYELYVMEGFNYEIFEPTRKGYTFKGWQMTGNNSYIRGRTLTMGLEDTEIKARWQINTYNVEIKDSDLCDGEYPVDYNTALDLCVPTKTGYTFAGWDITSGMLDGNSFIVDDKDAVVTAKWQINNYDYVVYHMQQGLNGDYVLKDIDTYSAEYQSEVSPETRTYTGFTSPNRKTIEIAIRDNEVNYQYTRNKYSLSIDPNNGEYSGSRNMQLYYEEQTELSIPTRVGYNFRGWDKTSGDVTDSIFTMDASDANLTAKWEAKKFIVTFDANGGSLSQTTKEVTYDSEYGQLATATRTGYNFLGWYTSASGGTKITSSSTVKITSNQTLYAHWQAKTFTVTFNANGGSVSTSSKTVTYDSTYGTLPTPTRTNYDFLGWYTDATNGTKVESTTTVKITSNQTLYAHWKLSTVTITYNANGGSVSPSSVDITVGGKISSLPTPTRSNYIFMGWYDSTSCTNKITTSTTFSTNKTIYAHWLSNNGVNFVKGLPSCYDDSLLTDGTSDNNLRYVGASPNNYVKFNNELWRIIGVMNNITNSSGTKQSLLKIMRNSPLGSYSWDSSEGAEQDVGMGINQWGPSGSYEGADLMRELNYDYLGNVIVGTDGYWYNGGSGRKNAAKPSTTINSTSQAMIENVVWNLGAPNNNNGTFIYDDSPGFNAPFIYNHERANTHGKMCSSYYGNCSDNVTRTSTWTGKVALIYPSDYLYATSGGGYTSRSACLNKIMDEWWQTDDCDSNDWITPVTNICRDLYHTLSPQGDDEIASHVYTIDECGSIHAQMASVDNLVNPVIHLKSTTKITGGSGSQSDPYILSQ